LSFRGRIHDVTRTVRLAAAALAVALSVAGCAADDTPALTAASGKQLGVVASFYPLEFVAQRVGGPRIEVGNLTKPGGEPHDLELTPQDVKRIAEADLVLVLKGFQPAVDDAVAQRGGTGVFDAATAAQLNLSYAPLEEEHEGEQEGEHEGEQEKATDPHFWLDPTRLAAVGDALAERFAQLDQARAAEYRADAKALRGDLERLDGEFRAGLARCADRSLVTSHNAFGYLANRYDLRQVGIAGLSPENEPAPGELAEVARFAKSNKVRTIYYETLVSPDIARTVAAETGAATAVLDPLEGLSDASSGRDYLAIMRANLETLRKGQSCS
jgi:zinc transport system substrate-binding protein